MHGLLSNNIFLDIDTWFFLKYVSKEICQYDNFVKVFKKKVPLMNQSLYYENTKKFMKCKTSTSYSAYVVFAIWIYEDLLKDVRIPKKEKNQMKLQSIVCSNDFKFK